MINVKKVRDRMAELGLRQRDLAETMGISQPAVSQKLSRDRPVDLDEAEKLAELLKISDEELSEYFFEGRKGT